MGEVSVGAEGTLLFFSPCGYMPDAEPLVEAQDFPEHYLVVGTVGMVEESYHLSRSWGSSLLSLRHRGYYQFGM
jgi:hypothetical protein